MMELRQYINAEGKNAFEKWFKALDGAAATKVSTPLFRMEQGNLSNTKTVGGGVQEYKINWGPGYRIYFGKDGEEIVILLGGGTKKRQSRDITNAQALWSEYKRLKRQGR